MSPRPPIAPVWPAVAPIANRDHCQWPGRNLSKDIGAAVAAAVTGLHAAMRGSASRCSRRPPTAPRWCACCSRASAPVARSSAALAGSEIAATAACASYRGHDPQLALVFSSAARKWVLGTQAEKECEMLQRAFARCGVKAAMAGLYVFGEIAPSDQLGLSQFHNETCVTVLPGP